MTKIQEKRIDEDWNLSELEEVKNCPFCESSDRTLEYENVKDWSFQCAPGEWSYWRCSKCAGLYLNPRPKEAFIHKAYDIYYTHVSGSETMLRSLKDAIRNECYSHWLDIDLQPRLNLPQLLAKGLDFLREKVQIPFGLSHLATLRKGKLLDVGCGSGNLLNQAKQMGWDVMGLEIDHKAVARARSQGLKIIEGDYRNLVDLEKQFDCIVCSHVIEHVYDAKSLIQLLLNGLKEGGVLLLSCPNSTSRLADHFGRCWRGLEAPRHIAIPSESQLKKMLNFQGQDQSLDSVDNCLLESQKIAMSVEKRKRTGADVDACNDFINIVKYVVK
jgi:2-polyprenyl-3-methyl-5-hydroxy-6-metoxy-1,4-benzoquinol methylase